MAERYIPKETIIGPFRTKDRREAVKKNLTDVTSTYDSENWDVFRKTPVYMEEVIKHPEELQHYERVGLTPYDYMNDFKGKGSYGRGAPDKIMRYSDDIDWRKVAELTNTVDDHERNEHWIDGPTDSSLRYRAMKDRVDAFDRLTPEQQELVRIKDPERLKALGSASKEVPMRGVEERTLSTTDRLPPHEPEKPTEHKEAPKITREDWERMRKIDEEREKALSAAREQKDKDRVPSIKLKVPER